MASTQKKGNGRKKAPAPPPPPAYNAAARLAGEAGFALEAGWTVLLGSATPAEAIRAGSRVRLETEGMATVDIALTGAAA